MLLRRNRKGTSTSLHPGQCGLSVLVRPAHAQEQGTSCLKTVLNVDVPMPTGSVQAELTVKTARETNRHGHCTSPCNIARSEANPSSGISQSETSKSHLNMFVQITCRSAMTIAVVTGAHTCAACTTLHASISSMPKKQQACWMQPVPRLASRSWSGVVQGSWQG